MAKKEKKVSPLKSSCLWGLLGFGILLLIDMVTKVAAHEYFSGKPVGEKVDVIPEWISLCITYNKGIAYGIGGDSPTWVKLAVIAATAVMMLALTVAYFVMDKRRSFIRFALVLVVAGGVGNLLDRVYYRVWEESALYGVRDMVDLSRFGFAVCNFADFFISIGAVLLVLGLVFFDKDALCPVGKYRRMMRQEKAEKEKAEQAKEGAERVAPVETAKE